MKRPEKRSKHKSKTTGKCRLPVLCYAPIASSILLSICFTQLTLNPAVAQETPQKQDAGTIESLKQALIKFDTSTAFGTIPSIISKTSRATEDKEQYKGRLAKSFIYAGYTFLLDSNPEAARNCFATAVSITPGNLEAKCFLSEALKELYKFKEQEELLAEFQNLEVKTGFVYEQLAKDKLRKKETRAALDLIETGLALEVNNCKNALLVLRAKACAQMGYGPATIKAYKEAAEATENDYIKEILTADSFLIDSDLKNTKQHLLNASKILPDDPIWQYKLGNYYAGEDDSTRAIEYLLSSTVTQRLSASAYINLANQYAYKQEFENALQAIEHIKKLLPHNASIYDTEGDIHKQANQVDEAFKAYNHALELNPYLARTYYEIALLFTKSKQQDKALATYDQALKLMPQYWRMHFNRAEILWMLKLPEKAKEECLTALNLLPKPVDSLNILSRHYASRAHAMLCAYFYNKKDLKNAIAEAIRFNEIKYIPVLPKALSYVKLRPERLVFASDLSEQDPLILVALADALFEVNEFDSSEIEYRKAVKLSPEDADVHSYLLNVLTHKKDWGEAAKENFVYSGKIVNKIPGQVGEWISGKEENPQK